MTEPSSAGSKDVQEALAALERLVTRHKLVSLDQARQAARIITGDAGFEFPPPAPSPAQAAVVPTAAPAPAKDEPAAAPPST